MSPASGFAAGSGNRRPPGRARRPTCPSAGERVGHAATGRSPVEDVRGAIRNSRRKRRRQFVNGGIDLAAQRDVAYRRVAGARRRRQVNHAPLLLGVEHRTTTLRPSRGPRQPRTPRSRRRAAGRCARPISARSALYRCTRATKQPGLLAGDDGHRGVAGEQRRGLARGRRRVAARELRLQDGGELRALARMFLRARDRLGPRRRRRGIAGKKRRERGKLKRVIGGELPDPGKTSNVDRNARRFRRLRSAFGRHCGMLPSVHWPTKIQSCTSHQRHSGPFGFSTKLARARSVPSFARTNPAGIGSLR